MYSMYTCRHDFGKRRYHAMCAHTSMRHLTKLLPKKVTKTFTNGVGEGVICAPQSRTQHFEQLQWMVLNLEVATKAIVPERVKTDYYFQ